MAVAVPRSAVAKMMTHGDSDEGGDAEDVLTDINVRPEGTISSENCKSVCVVLCLERHQEERTSVSTALSSLARRLTALTHYRCLSRSDCLNDLDQLRFS
jgi:hypothetical protein